MKDEKIYLISRIFYAVIKPRNNEKKTQKNPFNTLRVLHGKKGLNTIMVGDFVQKNIN